ncbi:hypothetical protein Tco_0674244 [Tanacetum coccineum]
MSDSTGGGLSDLDDMDDIEMIMQQLQSDQEQEQEAESSHRRNYIYRECEDAEERSLVAYSNADWACCPNTRSTSVTETAWLRNLLRELHTPLLYVTLVYCDNVRKSLHDVGSVRKGLVDINMYEITFLEFRCIGCVWADSGPRNTDGMISIGLYGNTSTFKF